MMPRALALFLFSASFCLFVISCGGKPESASEFEKIQPSEFVFDISSLDGIGFKKVREYDITGLPDALSAYMGYYRPLESDPVQYEVRFYSDHLEASSIGVEFADEVTGEDAILRSADLRWAAGARDRLVGSGWRYGLYSLYADYIVLGNMVLLCEGRDSDQSFARCEALIRAASLME